MSTKCLRSVYEVSRKCLGSASVSVRSAWSKMAPSPARSPATAAARMSAREKSVAVTVAPVRSASSKSALLERASQGVREGLMSRVCASRELCSISALSLGCGSL